MERARHSRSLGSLILVRPDRIGDVVISTSCLAPIKAQFPDAKLYFVAAETMRPLLEGHSCLERFISLNSDLAAKFQGCSADAIVHLHPNELCYQAGEQARIPLRIGYAVRGWERYLSIARPDQRRQGLKHEAEYNFDLLQTLDIKPFSKLRGDVHLSPANHEFLARKLPANFVPEQFVVIHSLAHSPFARWPEERFIQVAEKIRVMHKLLPVFIGGERQELNSAANFEHLNLTGKINLGELGWLLASAKCLISNDSGPAHLAAAVGCPVVAIFGRTAPMYGPVRWAPLADKSIIVARPIWRRWFERRESHWRRSFAKISVDEVLAAVDELISANP